MCICFYTLSHPVYSLVLITNRDEFLQRPTLKAHWHGQDGSVLSGLDVQAGGTWCGIERRGGRFGLLTNVREEATTRPNQLSRGRLVSDWLEEEDHTQSVQQYLDNVLRPSMMHYAGFNLLLGKINPKDGSVEMGFVSNRSQKAPQSTAKNHDSRVMLTEALRLETAATSLDSTAGSAPSFADYGVLSNGALAYGGPSVINDTLASSWPKMLIGQKAFQQCVTTDSSRRSHNTGGLDNEECAVRDRKAFVDDLLSTLNLAFPNLKDKEDVRSSVLVTPFDMFPSNKAWYATRAQTVLLVKRVSDSHEHTRVYYAERQAYEVDHGDEVRWNGSMEEYEFRLGS